MCVYIPDVCTGIDKVSMKGSFQATKKKLTTMVIGTYADCRFLEHDVPAQLLLIYSQRSLTAFCQENEGSSLNQEGGD